MVVDMGQQSLYEHFKPLKEMGDDEATTALIPFNAAPLSLTSSTSGVLTYPADYANTEAIYETINGQVVSMNTVLDVELADALSSVLYPIALNPRYLEMTDGIHIYPRAVHAVELHYLSRPTTPVIGYTVSGNTIIYDPTTSVQLQFSNQYWRNIIHHGLPYVGVNLSDQDLVGLYQLFGQPQPIPQ